MLKSLITAYTVQHYCQTLSGKRNPKRSQLAKPVPIPGIPGCYLSYMTMPAGRQAGPSSGTTRPRIPCWVGQGFPQASSTIELLLCSMPLLPLSLHARWSLRNMLLLKCHLSIWFQGTQFYILVINLEIIKWYIELSLSQEMVGFIPISIMVISRLLGLKNVLILL